MKLTKADCDYLLGIGYTSKDFPQIERAARKTTYEHYPRIGAGWKISQKRAVELLGRNEFLSGLSRSAFHWSAMRETEAGDQVYFDSSRFFE